MWILDLRSLIEAAIFPDEHLSPRMNKANQLTTIPAASAMTARKDLKRKRG